MTKTEFAKLVRIVVAPSAFAPHLIKSTIVICLIALFTGANTTALADFGASPKTSCSSGYKWCKKKNKCVYARCKSGRIWSASSCRCVRRSSGLMNDEDLYLEAVSLAKSKHYSEALDLLKTIKDQNQTHVLSYIGYSTRKLGKLDEGINYYHKALSLDPANTLAREYLGEGLLAKGDLAGAKLQLAEIKKHCGTTCHEYEELAEEIADYVSKLN